MTTDQISTHSQLIVCAGSWCLRRAARDIQLCNWDEVCEQDNQTGGACGLDRQKTRGNEGGGEREREGRPFRWRRDWKREQKRGGEKTRRQRKRIYRGSPREKSADSVSLAAEPAIHSFRHRCVRTRQQ